MGLTLPQKQKLQLGRLPRPAHPNSPLALQHHSQLCDRETPAQAKCLPTPSDRAEKQEEAPRGAPNFSPAPRASRRPSLGVPSHFQCLRVPVATSPCTQARRGLGSRVEECCPAPKSRMGVGRRRQTSNMLKKKKKKGHVPQSQSGSPHPSELCAVHLDHRLPLTLLCQGDLALGPWLGVFPLMLACGGAAAPASSTPQVYPPARGVKN